MQYWVYYLGNFFYFSWQVFFLDFKMYFIKNNNLIVNFVYISCILYFYVKVFIFLFISFFK